MDKQLSKNIENQLLVDGREIDISNGFAVTLKDNEGKEYSIPVNETFIDISVISKNARSYVITFQFANYKLGVDLFTKDIVPKEDVIWIWSIDSDTMQENDEQKCSLKFEYTEAEIEILWPVDFCEK
jgi:hypothetical protein